MRHVKLVQAVAAAPEDEEKAASLRALAELGQARMLELRACAMEMQQAIEKHRRETLPFGGGIGDRACHNCGERGHFARDCPAASGDKRACHTCGSIGHLAKDCPQGPVIGDRTCHVCGERGHFARDCKQATCLKCGKTGHKQFECPENVCFKCGKSGHFAKDCVNPPAARGPPPSRRDAEFARDSPRDEREGPGRPPRDERDRPEGSGDRRRVVVRVQRGGRRDERGGGGDERDRRGDRRDDSRDRRGSRDDDGRRDRDRDRPRSGDKRRGERDGDRDGGGAKRSRRR